MGGGLDLKDKSTYPLFAQTPVGVPKTSILKGRIEPFYKSGQYDKVNLLACVASLNMYSIPCLVLT